MKSIEDKIVETNLEQDLMWVFGWVGAINNIKWITMLTNEERLNVCYLLK
jgi:hypothetical protein